MEKNEINYRKFTIVQASQVKEEWEIKKWKRDEVTIASIDKQDYVSEIATNTFPYLDIEFLWNADGENGISSTSKTKSTT